MHNISGKSTKPFTVRRYWSLFSSVATDRNSNQHHKLWRLYWSSFVVVVTGVNGECYIPAVKRLDIFNGEIVHSSNYKSGHDLKGKTVLVARGGNSSMEMCFALNNLDARMAVSTRKYGIFWRNSRGNKYYNSFK